jgi:Ca-activated chloride channel family protein
MSLMRGTLLALGLCAGLAVAKGADDYLHGGASLYIQSRLQEASVEVEEGLRKFPNDTRLKALADQLKSMKDQQKQDQGGGEGQGGEGDKQKQNKPDSSQDQKGQGKQDQKQDQKQDKPKQDQQQKDQDKDKQGGDKDKDKDKDQNGQANNPPPQAQPGKEGDSTGKGAAPVPPGQMSKEEAERLLNSYQDDEKREQKNMQRRSRKPVEVEEDW